MQRPLHIAIDGPVASGKSTVARELARRLGCDFLDTGPFYRAAAYLALRHGVDTNDEAAVVRLLELHPPTAQPDASSPLGYRIAVDGQTLSDELFRPDIARHVSAVAAMPAVRTILVQAQRAAAEGRDIVMAGRDIGSVVLRDAPLKFYLTASLDQRVDRRLRDLHAQGIQISREELRRDIERRDRRDSERAVSPLVRADDAIVIDSTDKEASEVVDMLCARVKDYLNEPV